MDEEDEAIEKKGKPKKEKAPKAPKPPKPPKAPKQKKGKAKNEDGEEGSGIGKKILGFLLFLLVFGGIGAFLFFNVFGVRQNYVIPQLRKIPVVKSMIPYLEGEVVEEVADPENPDSGLSKKLLLEKIATLEEEVVKLQTDDASKEGLIAERNEKILELEKYKNEQETFKENKKQFDIMIGEENPDAFSAFYEQMNPDTAAKIYEEAIVKKNIDEETKRYAATFQDMKAKSAAPILEELMRTNIERVIYILENVDSKQRGEILAAMTARNAATITKRLLPNP